MRWPAASTTRCPFQDFPDILIVPVAQDFAGGNNTAFFAPPDGSGGGVVAYHAKPLDRSYADTPGFSRHSDNRAIAQDIIQMMETLFQSLLERENERRT